MFSVACEYRFLSSVDSKTEKEPVLLCLKRTTREGREIRRPIFFLIESGYDSHSLVLQNKAVTDNGVD